ncbi:hypothetical protein EV182_006354 [Spiromyces aspiralis]|uniref:Uncharacterized protein n=1 Tax=Spiromyces aspiralis TaxID=68401 RepID=A0ACC1HQ30_9FUNG|nr:hypothetical protein EV182_006354 [Spiromyces aspiralis]
MFGKFNVAQPGFPNPQRPIMHTLHHRLGASPTSSTQRKRYLCPVCSKLFARPSTLDTHMHSHTGEKPYECDYEGCGKRFSVMSNLRRHQRIHERQRAKYSTETTTPNAGLSSSAATTPTGGSSSIASSGSSSAGISETAASTPTKKSHLHHHIHFDGTSALSSIASAPPVVGGDGTSSSSSSSSSGQHAVQHPVDPSPLNAHHHLEAFASHVTGDFASFTHPPPHSYQDTIASKAEVS